MRRPNRGYVYLIVSKDRTRAKVGHTRRPIDRFWAVAPDLGRGQMVLVIRGSLKTESSLLTKFRPFLLKGREWFAYDPVMLEYMSKRYRPIPIEEFGFCPHGERPCNDCVQAAALARHAKPAASDTL